MPTQIPGGEKTAFIAIVAQVDPYEATRLSTLLHNYEDIVPIAIGRQITAFANNNDYLLSALSVFTDANLVAVGIYNNKTGSTRLTDPVFISNSTYTGGIVLDIVSSPPANIPVLLILGNSSVDSVSFAAATRIKNIIVGPGSSVGYINSSASGAYIGLISLLFYDNAPSRLGFIVFGSNYGSVTAAEGSYYGGVKNIPTGSCATDVTDLATGNVVHNSVQLTWTNPGLFSPPVKYLSQNVSYRKKGSNVWLAADASTGLFDGDSGYTFNSLDEDTFYEFKVSVTCVNGATSAGVVVSIQTSCCN
jgi:hypothetical protein